MQNFALALGALLLGFVLGGLKPRADLHEAAEKHAEELAEACPEPERMRVMPGLGELLPELSAPEPSPSEADGANDGYDGSPIESDDALSAPQDDLGDEFDLAVEAQNLRAAQSRQALAEQAELTDEELAELDDILATMNDDLAFYGEDLLAMAMSQDPDPTEALGLTHDVTGVLYESQLALDELIGDAAVDEEARMVWNHLDLAVFRDTVEAVEAAD